MKRQLPIFLFCFGCLVSSWNVEAATLVINELSPDPADGYPEFIEIYNPSAKSQNLDGFFLVGPGSVLVRFGADQEIGGHAYFVLSPDAELFREAYGVDPDGSYTGDLTANSGRVELTSEAANFVARATYGEATGSLWRGAGASLERLAPHLDGSRESSWQASLHAGGTPGEENSIRRRLDILRVIPEKAEWSYFKGLEAPPGESLAWARPDYDDSAWLSGRVPIGFGNFDDQTVLEDMRRNYSTVYLRRRFRFRNPGNVLQAEMRIIFDDGFVAYLNGREIARRNMGAEGTPVAHDGVASARQEREGVAVSILLSVDDLLVEGENVLAIHAANDHVRSGDFVIDPAIDVTAARRPPPTRPKLILNEVWVDGAATFLELLNDDRQAVDLDGYAIELRGERIELVKGLQLESGEATVLALGAVNPGGTRITLLGKRDELIASEVFPFVRPGGSAGLVPDRVGTVRALPRPTPGKLNASPMPGAVVISEIHYHPSDASLEFIELYARESVELGSWTVTDALRFVFSEDLRLEPGDSVVIARDPRRLLEARPDIPIDRIVGPFDGRMSNTSERILLRDAEGFEVDRVVYADDGAWPSEADGGGSSLELVDPDVENDSGFAWRASAAENGSPGLPNSTLGMEGEAILELIEHAPLIPRPGEELSIRARVLANQGNVILLFRKDGDKEYSRLAMDREGDDYLAVLPGGEHGDIFEYALEVTNERGGKSVAFPRDSSDPDAKAGSWLCLVDGTRESLLAPTYRIIIRRDDLNALNADVFSNELRPATMVADGKIFQNIRLRYRGNGSRDNPTKSFQVRFSDQHAFPDGKRIFLNAFEPHRQIMGMDVWRDSGMSYSGAKPVQIVLNGVFFPHYAQIEPIDDDYLERHFGSNGSAGNLYRGERTADFSYQGDLPAPYELVYAKQTNEEAADWSDIIDATRVFALTSDEDFPEEISRHIEVQQWIRWLAINEVLSNQEGGLHRDTGDDYFVYRPQGGRLILLPWDMDSTYLEAQQPILRPSIPSIRRLISHPEFAPLYYSELLRATQLMSSERMDRRKTLIEGIYSAEIIDEFVTFARDRVDKIRRSIPTRLSVEVASPDRIFGSEVFAATENIELSGRAPAATTQSVKLAGRTVSYDAEHATWSTSLRVNGRPAVLLLQAYDREGREVDRKTITLRRLDADSVVSGEISESDLRWAARVEPYFVDDVEVLETAKLTIEDGARLLLSPTSRFIVHGEVAIEGEIEAYRPDRALVSAIEVRPGASLRLQASRVRAYVAADASEVRPLIAGNDATIIVRDSNFEDISGVVLDAFGGRLEVYDSTFRRTGETMHGEGATLIAVGNVIEDVLGNSDGIDLDESPGGSRIEGNTILRGGDDGIDLLNTSAQVLNNVVMSCDDRGISVDGEGAPHIEGNLVVSCVDGIALKDGTEVTGSHNTVTACLNGIRVFIKEPGADRARGEFHSSIVWGNERSVFVDSESELRLDRSDVEGVAEAWGDGNIDADPRFVGGVDFRLRKSSPCLGTGLEGSDMGAFSSGGVKSFALSDVSPRELSTIGGEIVTLEGRSIPRQLIFEFAGIETVQSSTNGRIVRWRTPAPTVIGDSTLTIRTLSGEVLAEETLSVVRDLLRGDANSDRRLNMSDGLAIATWIGMGGPAPVCESVADTNEDGLVGIADAVFLLRHLFLGAEGPEEVRVDCVER